MTMVDAYGPAACCDVCNEEADEADLEDDAAGRMVCGHCRDVQRELIGVFETLAKKMEK